MSESELKIKWNKKEQDFEIFYPRKCDGSLMIQIVKPWKWLVLKSLTSSWLKDNHKIVSCYEGALGNYSLLELDWISELESRGYDKTTLKISIKKKKLLTNPTPYKE